MKNRKWMGRALGAALLAGSLGACDFIEISGEDPNIITEPTLASLFVSAQLNAFAFSEGQLARVSAVWTQQLAGVDRQFSLLDRYVFGEDEADGEFAGLYTGGGLVDIRRGRAVSDSVGCPQCAALFQIHEAYLFGMGASIFGDLPYRGALVEGTPAPLDPQQQVYADVQALLDQAIASLSTAPAGGAVAFYGQLTAVDLDATRTASLSRARWTAIANTLKARFYLHWVEAQRAGGASAAAAATACGGDCLAKAEAAAANGIMSAAGDWDAQHNTPNTESSFWYQFFEQRAGYAVAGQHLITLLQNRSDPRLARYFSTLGGQYVGSAPGQNRPGSVLNTAAGVGAGARDYDVPMVTCAENHFIIAEVNYYQNDFATARTALENGIRCAEDMQGLARGSVLTAALDAAIDNLSGAALLTEIITQKYIALFLNMEVYNDYKRTCLPALATYQGKPIPGRLLYGQQERQTNPNIPAPDQQPAFNRNDPVRC